MVGNCTQRSWWTLSQSNRIKNKWVTILCGDCFEKLEKEGGLKRTSSQRLLVDIQHILFSRLGWGWRQDKRHLFEGLKHRTKCIPFKMATSYWAVTRRGGAAGMLGERHDESVQPWESPGFALIQKQNWLFGNSENAFFYMLRTCVQRMIHFMSTFIYTIKGLTRPPVYLFHNILFILNSFFWISDDQKSYRQRDTSHLLTFQMKFIGTTLMKSFWVPIMRCTRYIFLVDTDVWFFLLPIKLFFSWIFTKDLQCVYL